MRLAERRFGLQQVRSMDSEKTDKVMVMVRAFYVLMSSGEYWRKVFAETLCDMYFLPMVADLDVYCIRVRKPNGEEYYELILVYVNDVLCFSNSPKLVMGVLALMYDMKDGLAGPPKIYLGTEIKKYQFNSFKSHWVITSTHYMNNMIKAAEVLFKDEDRHLRKFNLSGKEPLENLYRPDSEQIDELTPELLSRYLKLIGILN